MSACKDVINRSQDKWSDSGHEATWTMRGFALERFLRSTANRAPAARERSLPIVTKSRQRQIPQAFGVLGIERIASIPSGSAIGIPPFQSASAFWAPRGAILVFALCAYVLAALFA